MGKRVSEYLVIEDVGGQKVIQCSRCQYVYCAATENCKNYALMREFSPPKPGTILKESKRFVLREFYCPQCGTMFDLEVRLKEQPFLWDARLEV